MRNLHILFGFLTIFAFSSHAQVQQAPSPQNGPLNTGHAPPVPDQDGVYRQGPEIVAPLLLHPVAAAGDLVEKCAPNTMVIPAVIGADGSIAIIETPRPDDLTCQSGAIDAIKRSSFQPGTRNSKPVPVLACLDISYLTQAKESLPSIQPCPENLNLTTFEGQVVYRVGGAVKPPVPIYHPPAEFSDEARRNHYQGICLVALIVDAQGNPQNARIVRALGMGLDEKAVEAIRRYRFKPATFDGNPVPVQITIEVDFRLYQRSD